MAHRLGLAKAGQSDRRMPLKPGKAGRKRLRLFQIYSRHIETADLENQRLFDRQRAIAGEGDELLGGGEFRTGWLDVHAASTSFSALA